MTLHSARPKLCTSIAAGDPPRMRRKAEFALSLGSDLVEFRLDSLKRLDVDAAVDSLSGFARRCVLTLRPKAEGGMFAGSDSTRIELLSSVCKMRPAYADVELGTARRFRNHLKRMREDCGELIISWHDFQSTPVVSKLVRLYNEARALGGIAKTITTARAVEDNARVLSLYRSAGEKDLIAFCMGQRGTLSRILCLFAGSPFTYCALPNESVALGQLTIRTMRMLLDAVSW